jgi:hypothetical protein
MLFGLPEDQVIAYFMFGIIFNFVISALFGSYILKNVGMHKMMELSQNYRQPAWVGLMIFIPFAKVALVLYRAYILQIYFLNRGLTHLDFFEHLVAKYQEK